MLQLDTDYYKPQTYNQYFDRLNKWSTTQGKRLFINLYKITLRVVTNLKYCAKVFPWIPFYEMLSWQKNGTVICQM